MKASKYKYKPSPFVKWLKSLEPKKFKFKIKPNVPMHKKDIIQTNGTDGEKELK